VSRVRLLSRPGCHLCDEARTTIESVCAELGESYDEIDITTDPVLMREFADQIPVTFVDNQQHDFWHVDGVRLRTALTR
jgi:glutaredoxin